MTLPKKLSQRRDGLAFIHSNDGPYRESFEEGFNACAAELFPLVSELMEALTYAADAREHTEDCSDANEDFGAHETCECGAIIVQRALAQAREKLGDL